MISVSRVAKCHGYSNCIHEGYDDEVDDDDINDVDHSIGTRVERECPQAAAVIHSQMKEAACSMTMMSMVMMMMMMMEMIIQLGWGGWWWSSFNWDARVPIGGCPPQAAVIHPRMKEAAGSLRWPAKKLAVMPFRQTTGNLFLHKYKSKPLQQLKTDYVSSNPPFICPEGCF